MSGFLVHLAVWEGNIIDANGFGRYKMLIVPVSDVEIGFFAYVLLAWGGLLFGGLFINRHHPKSSQQMPRWTRLASSCVLVIGAWMWFAVTLGTKIEMLVVWLALGMSLSWLGDIWLAGILDRRYWLVEGMSLFALAHISYIVGLLGLGNHLALLDWPTVILSLGIFGLSGVAGWYVIVWYQNTRDTASYGALPYTLLLCATAGLSVALAIESPHFLLIAVGAVLFLLSDLILAIALFRAPQKGWLHDMVWMLYGTGQMLIVFGTLLQLVLGWPEA